MAWVIFFQSASVRLPLRTFVESTRASEHSMRWVSSSWLISSEKNSTGRLGLDRGVGGHAEGERGLAHGGAGADDDEGVGLQAREQLVEVEEAGGHAGDGLAPLVERLEAVEVGVEQVADRAMVSVTRRWATSKTSDSAWSTALATSSGRS